MRSIMANSIIIVLVAISSSFATTYKISNSGDDNNDGTTWGTAWATVDKVNDNLLAGDTVLFGTGIYYNSSIQPPAGGSNSNWTVYACSSFTAESDADKLAGKHLAKVWGGTIVTDWSDTTIGGNSVYKAAWVGSDCYYGKCYTLGHGDSLLIPQTELSYVDQAGEFFHNDTDGILYAWLYGSANPNTSTMIASCKPVVWPKVDDISHVRIWGLDLQFGKVGVVFWAGLTDSMFIEHCHIAKAGSAWRGNPSCVHSFHNPNKNGRWNHVVACSLGWAVAADDNTQGTPPLSGYGHGGAIALYSQEYFCADSNYVYGFVNIGILFKMSLGNEAPYTGNVARFNYVTCKSDGIYFYNYPDRDSAYGNVIWGCEVGIRMRGGAGSDPALYVGKTFIANNTIYDVGKAFFSLESSLPIDADTCGEENKLLYNVAFKHNWSIPNNFFVGFPHANEFCDNAWTIDSNLYYDPTQAFQGWSAMNNCEALSDWQNTCGFDGGGDNINPILNDPANGDFSRLGAPVEMDRFYGGKHWTRFGAWQPGDTGLINYNIRATDITETSAIIRWNTNLPATSQVEYGLDQSYGFTTPIDWNLVTDHSVDLYGLTIGTTYHYRVISSDAEGNEAISGDYVFTTASGETSRNLALGITPEVCGTYPGYDVIPITDGVLNPYLGTSTTWASDESETSPHWVEIDFQDAKIVESVVIYWAWNNYRGTWMTSQEYSIQSWNGSSYDDVAVEDNPPSDSVTITNLEPVTASRIRIFQPAGMGPQDYPSIMWLAELEIYGSDTLTSTNLLTSDSNLYYPEAGQEVHTDVPVLAVKNLSNIGTVYFQVDDNEQFSSPTESGPVPTLGASTITWQTPDTLKNYSTYYWRASSDNRLWTNSWRFTVKLAIHAYPVPFRTVDGHTDITFTNLPAESRIVVATVSGSIVKTVRNAGPGDWVWDVKNDGGERLASGVYLYAVEFKNGSTDGKLMVIR